MIVSNTSEKITIKIITAIQMIANNKMQHSDQVTAFNVHSILSLSH